MPRAIGSLPVCPSVKPTGEPDALIGHVRFDERGWETERCRMAQATAPILDSTETDMPTALRSVRFQGANRKRLAHGKNGASGRELNPRPARAVRPTSVWIPCLHATNR